ncbi:MAG: sigma-54 dependent transcriptional regulator [Desulfobacteraceae bacterium]|jgi:DNA-binding NtrC family response regulator
MTESILIVDDEMDMLLLLKRSLEPALNCRIETASTAEIALQKIASDNFDLALVDIKMPGMDGLQLLELIKTQFSDLTVIMMTAFGHVDMAVEAMKSGAYDFITKPFEHDALVLRLEKALERTRLIKENIRLQRTCDHVDQFQAMVGKSPQMRRVYETIQMVAKNDLTVLITGESGTGKDLTARAVHNLSLRNQGPFIAVNCPTVPENILESELFGYKKGAFTHATQDKKGLFQEAHKGTIFLDEIGDISPTIQTKLLRVLQEKEIKPLGDSKAIKVDVRIIASTNQDLKEKIKQGEYREDFFYRLNVLPIELPALKERMEDIPLIANHLIEKHCRKLNKPLKQFSPELIEAFMHRNWEGNVREMENLIVQGILFSSGKKIFPKDIGLRQSANSGFSSITNMEKISYKEAKEHLLREFNYNFFDNLLSNTKGNVSQTARKCGLERQALQQILRRYGIKAGNYRNRS